MRILIGEISSYKAIVIARYVRDRYPDTEVWAYDYKPVICAIHTRYVQQCVRLPFRSLESYIAALVNYVQRNDIDVLIPVHSDIIGAILQHKSQFGHALDWLGDYSDYIQLHEKNQLMWIASSLGIRVPKTYETIAEAQVPFVIKPTNLSSAKGVRYIRTEAKKDSFRHSNNSLLASDIIQEYIIGQGCGYEVYCRNGEILVEYGHIRLAEWPTSGGSSVLREGFIHPQMRPIVEKVLSRIPWTGFAMFEFKLTPQNELVLIEVNPRIWGSINQALQDNSPLFTPILGQSQLVPQRTITNHQSLIRTSLFPHVWMAMFSYALRGRWEIVWDYWRHRKNTHRDVNFWSDPLGLISMVIRKLV